MPGVAGARAAWAHKRARRVPCLSHEQRDARRLLAQVAEAALKYPLTACSVRPIGLPLHSRGKYQGMFQITGVAVPNDNAVTIFGGLPDDRKARSIGETLGPEGSHYTLFVQDLGMLTLDDVGWTQQQAWGVQLNNSAEIVWLYSSDGEASIAVDASGAVSTNGVDIHTALVTHHNDDYIAAAHRFA